MGNQEHLGCIKGFREGVGLKAYFGRSSKCYRGSLIYMEDLTIQITVEKLILWKLIKQSCEKNIVIAIKIN